MVSIELAVLDSYGKRVQYKRQLHKNIEQYRRILLLNREKLLFKWFFFCKALRYLLYHGLQSNAHNYMMTVWLILQKFEVSVVLLTWSCLGGSFLKSSSSLMACFMSFSTIAWTLNYKVTWWKFTLYFKNVKLLFYCLPVFVREAFLKRSFFFEDLLNSFFSHSMNIEFNANHRENHFWLKKFIICGPLINLQLFFLA